MGAQTAAIAGLVVMFIVATVLPINMGALAFALAFLVGTVFMGLRADQIIAGFPGDLFVTLVGITYLFAIAQKNGTIDFLVHSAVRMVRGRIAAIPWIMFTVAACLTAVGAVSPAAVAILAPVALQFARQYGINPLMMGLLVIHGAQGGGFSPISIYGGITNQIVARSGIPGDEMVVFLASLVFNLLVAIAVFFAFGGLRLLRQKAGAGAEPGP
ncbi:SLC13 family permease [Roseomonas mucosa]